MSFPNKSDADPCAYTQRPSGARAAAQVVHVAGAMVGLVVMGFRRKAETPEDRSLSPEEKSQVLASFIKKRAREDAEAMTALIETQLRSCRPSRKPVVSAPMTARPIVLCNNVVPFQRRKA